MATHKQIQEELQKANELQKSIQQGNWHAKKQVLEAQIDNPETWNNIEEAKKIQKQLGIAKQKLELEKNLENAKNDLEGGIELELTQPEIEQLLHQLLQTIEKTEEEQFLQGKFDQKGAILSIHAGAGGLDAQDWSSMLVAMYQTFAKNMGFETKLVNLSLGEEGGVKSATLDIEGTNAYGLLKEEIGAHRLVRISPFNSGQTRETSFALVEVIPSGLENEIKTPVLQEKDLKWEYSMSSGKGGQSVNTTYSAVRLVHLPTGIAVSCQNERSQVQNKQMALKYLMNKLAIKEAQKETDLKKELRGEFHSAEWGSQIRSYTLHPYKLIKDHRSGFETTNTDSVLVEGKILDFIWAHKRFEQTKI